MAWSQCNFTNLNPAYCTTDAAFTLTGGTTYYGPGVSGSTFSPSVAGAGTHTLYTTNGATTSYTVNTTSSYYNPDATAGTTVSFPSLPGDESSPSTSIGFNFSFYGNTYSALTINANGYLIFGAPTNSGTNQTLPSATAPNNLIAAAWDNLDISTGGTVTTALVGTAPRRRFIVNFIGVRHSGAPQSVTVQVQLHESTNIIELHCQNIQFDGGAGMTQGIENSGGTAATVVTGRNNTNWTTAASYVAFIPSCTSQQSVVITAPPTALVPTNITSTICNGQKAQFTIPAQANVIYQLLRVSDNSPMSPTYTFTAGSNIIESNALTTTTDIKIHATNTAAPGCQADVYSFATITVLQPAAITVQPVASQTICEGGNANFSVTATGSSLSYQWRKNGVDIPSATANTYSITGVAAADNATYTVVVSNGCTPGINSSASVLTVQENAEITSPPANVTVCAGGPATFTVNPGVTTTPSYQWFKGATPVGTNSATYTIPSTVVGDAGSYSVRVSGVCGTPVNSAAVTLTVNTAPAISAQPVASQALCEGVSASFSVTATGTAPTYQWKKNGVSIGGATAATYTIPSIATADGAIYTVEVSGTCTPPVTSTGSVLTVRELPEVLADPASQTVCVGSPVTFSVNVGATTNPTYQWRKNGAIIVGATNPTYTIASVATGDAANYSVTVNGICGTPVTSGNGLLTVDTAPAITAQPVASQALCEGVSASFSVTATGTALTYQWKKNGVNIGGATSSTYTIPSIVTADGATYTVMVSGTCTPPVTSTGSVLTVRELPEILADPASQTVCAGSPVTFSVNVGVTTNPTYQWRKNGAIIVGATNPTYTIASVVTGDAANYSVTVNGICSTPVTSGNGLLTVDTAPAISAQPVASQALCEGVSVSFSVTATGTALTYQWKKNGVNIGGATSSTYTIPSIVTADGATYTVMVSGTCTPPVTSTGSVLTVRELPEILADPASQTLCAGSPVTFSVNVGATTTPSYQWLKNGSPIGGATNPTYSIASVATGDAGNYSVTVNGICGTPVTSGNALLTVNTSPAITAQPVASQALCEGVSASFSVTATGTALTYQWRKNGVNIGGATASTYTIPSIVTADGATYTVVISGTCTPPVTSTGSVLTVRELPEVLADPASQTVCAGSPVTFTVNVGVTTSPTYQWLKNGSPIGGATNPTYSIASVATTDAGNYSVTVNGICGTPVTSGNAVLTVDTAPAITAQPVASQALCEGVPASFSVTATGTSLTYQWKKNGVNIGGATSSTYTIPSIATADGATYTVTISGTCTPAVTSTGSVLTVRELPEILADPASQTLCAGSPVTFSVNVGVTTNPTYQWRKNGSPIGGATNPTYSIPSVATTDAGNYSVIVNGICGTPVTSGNAVLTVDTAPAITAQPVASQALCEGVPASFSVTATGTALTYQWRKNGINIGGATSSTYTIPSIVTADGATYTVVISGTCTPPVTSTGSVLTVRELPEILADPVSQTLCAGSPVTFSVNVGVTTNPSYQWRKNGSPIGGATNPTYTIASIATTDAGNYSVTVNGICGTPVTSGNAVLTVDTAPAITAQPVASQALCEGVPASFSVTATGTALTYQWRKNGVNIGGATSSTYTIPSIVTADGATYTVMISGTCTPPVTSTGSVLTVRELPEILADPVSQTLCAGSPVTFSVNVGVTTNPTYQWLKNGSPIGGATNPTYTIASVATTDAGNYSVTVNGICGTPVTSGDAVLTVNTAPAITAQPVASQALCEGVPASFSVTATGTALTYQWKKNGVNIGGATAATYTIPSLVTADGGTYTVMISGTCTPTVTSNASVLTVQELPEVLTGPASQTVCEGSPVTFSVNVGATTNPTYQWLKNGSPIGGATNPTYSIANVTTSDAGNYSVTVNGICGSPVTSGTAALTVNTSPVITAQPIASQSLCEGVPASFSVTATGTALTYQWRKNGVNIGGATSSTYTIPSIVTADGGTYTVVITGTCTPAVTSNASVLTIRELPEILAGPVSQTLCAGNPVTFSVNVGVTTNPTYQWLKNGSPIGGATNPTYTIASVATTDAGNYSVTVNGICGSPVTSATATLTVDTSPVITVQPVASQALCEGVPASFSVTATGTALTYQWRKNGVNIGGATSSTYTIPSLVTADGATYTVVISGTCTPPVTSNASVLTVQELPEVLANPASQTVCEGSPVTFSVNVGVTTNPTYQWLKNGSPIGGATNPTYSIASVTTSDAGNYSVTVNGICGSPVTSGNAVLTVNTSPVITVQPVATQSLCEGVPASFSVTATGTALTYQWKKNGVNIGGATASTYTIPAIATADGATYTVAVTGTCVPPVTSTASVLIVQEHPEIITGPVGRTVCEGSPVTFTVDAGVTTSPTYQWNKGGSPIGGAIASTFTIPAAALTDAGNYTVTVSGICAPPITSAIATLNVNKNPNATAADAAICSGQTTSIAITNPNGVPGTSFTWTVQSATNVSGASAGSGNLIGQLLTATDGVNPGYVTYLILPTSGAGCNGATYAVNVTVKPVPTVAASPQSICSGSSTSVLITNPNGVSGTTFSWTVLTTTNVTGAVAGNGSTISQILTSTNGVTPGSATYRIVPSAAGCDGSFVDVTVTVNPKPVITNSPTSLVQEICSGTPLNFLPTSTIGGTTFTWTSTVVGALTGVSASGNSAITDTPINTSNATGFIIYDITPAYSGCSGTKVSYVVMVKPIPNVFASPQTICSGSSTSIAITNPNGVTGTTFTWTVLSSTNVTGAAAGSGNLISQVLTSTDGINTGSVTYRITPMANGCPGTPFDVTATVKPVPVMTNPVASLSKQICSIQPLSFVPTSTIAGTTFSWTATITGPIDPSTVTATGAGNITDAPKNTGNVAGTVIYRIVPNNNGCAGTPVDFIVTVNPLPSATATDVVICSGGTAVITITPAPQNVAGTTFQWTASATANVTGAVNGNGSVISQMLSTTNALQGTVTYTITPSANTCAGPVKIVTATVNPVATVSAGTDFEVCEPVTIPVTGTLGGSATSGTWTIVGGGGTISSSTVSGTTVTATYTVVAGDIGNNVVLRLTTNDPDGPGATGPCTTVSDDVTIGVHRKARLTLPPNYTVCEPAMINLTGTLSGSATSGLWSSVSSNGTLSATSVTGTTVASNYSVVLADVTNTLTFRLTTNDPDGLGPCLAESADINIHVNESAKVNAGVDFPVCEDKIVNLAGSYSGTTSMVTWSGGSGASRFSNVNSPTSTYSLTPADIAAGGITLTLTTNDPDGAGPSGPCGPSSDQVFIKINKLPEVSFANLKAQYAENNPIEVLEGFPKTGGVGIFTGPGIIAGTDQFNPANAGYGLITITYTFTDANTCQNSFSRNTIVNPVTTIDFSIENQTTDVNGLPQICAESGSPRLIGYPSVNDPSAKSPTFFSSTIPMIQSRISSVTTGSTTEFMLNTVGLPAGSYTIDYTFTNTLNATTTLTKSFTVFSAPVADITISSICIESQVTFSDNSSIPNNTSGGTIISYEWIYGEAGNGNDGVTRDPVYKYQTPGLKAVTLTVTTDQGCSNTDAQDLRVGPVPIVDFTSTKFCSGLETTEFRDATQTGGFSSIVHYDWDFGDGDVISGPTGDPVPTGGKNSGTYTDPNHRYDLFKVYDVQLTVQTNDGCTSAKKKKIFILDYNIPSPIAGYSTDFANGPGSWVAVTSGAQAASDTSWIFGPPNGNVIVPSSPGHNAWWTGKNNQTATDNSTYFNNENSQVIGPCLNLEKLKRPMISLNYWVDTQEGFDGAVVQYSVDGGNSWETVGNADGYGIEWYNKRDVSSEPGGQDNFAWSQSDDTKQWRNARFNLDKIPLDKRSLVVFRIAFASNDDNPGSSDHAVFNGFAFDEIYIGEKTRNVLVEHFTNDNYGPANVADQTLQDLYDAEMAERDSSDFILVQYHMSSPVFDQLNKDNPGDQQARARFYGVSQPPTTIMDGIQGQYFNTYFTGGYDKISRDEIDRRALEDALFDINIDSVHDSGGNDTHMRPRITYTYSNAKTALSEPVILQAALLERGVAGNGNVLRKLLLQSEGVTVTKTWNKGDLELASPEYTLDVPIVDPDSLFILAWVQQKNAPQRILQSKIVATKRKKGIVVVGVDDPVMAELNGLNIYPNPAKHRLNISTDIVLKKTYTWKMIDQRGVTVLSGDLQRNFSDGPQQVDVSGLPNAIYIMSIQTGDTSVIYRKIAVMN
ncbi:immunoglobulin domain-containing protein [Chryseolinea soli]|uniref:immunoglobulin domain-containing protein n=1 Tax=Chryseolinea soli TaxID=2321403 RepID=UPI00135A25E7|nr:immunoglobulin domain-containing protein [Chryseolinea soli]